MADDIHIIPVTSDPDDLLSLAKGYGADCSHVTFSEVYSFDPEILDFIPKPVVSIIFLFPMGPKGGPIDKRHSDDPDPYITNDPSNIPIFSLQTVPLLCGTMAMIHNIANNQDIMPIKPGSWMDRFLKETKNQTPIQRAEFIHQSNDLFEIHNKIATKSDAPIPGGKIDTHFACFTKVGDNLWELDGRQPHPINHGKCEDDILLKTIEVIKNEFFVHLQPQDQIRTSIIAMSKT